MPAARILTFIATAAVAVTAFAAPSYADMSPALQRVFAAVKNQPRMIQVPAASAGYVYYDMRVDRLCGSGSISEAAMNWVDEPVFPGTVRAVAMSATFSFPQAFPARPDVTVPLIVAANSGDRIQNCDPLTFSDIPRNERLKVRIDFAAKEGFRVFDVSPIITSVGKVVTSLGALTSYGGSPVVAGGAAVVSFLTSNTQPVANLTAAVNELLTLLDVRRSPWSTIRPVESIIGRASYRDATGEVFALQKGYKETTIVSDPTGPISQIPSDFSRLVKRNWDDVVADVMNANPAFWESLDRFCPAFRRTLSRAANADQIAVALGLYYHAGSNSDSYLQAPASGRTCLNTAEIALLTSRHWIKPFDGVLSFQKAAWPGSQTQVAAR